jgi:hypothetical protein
MLFINAIRRRLAGRSGTSTPRQPGLTPMEEQRAAPTALSARSMSAPRRSRPHLAARWEVEGLFPDSTGRPMPRLRWRWSVQEAGTPASEDARAQGVAGSRPGKIYVAGEARVS